VDSTSAHIARFIVGKYFMPYKNHEDHKRRTRERIAERRKELFE
jgi:hypothetical protein